MWGIDSKYFISIENNTENKRFWSERSTMKSGLTDTNARLNVHGSLIMVADGASFWRSRGAIIMHMFTCTRPTLWLDCRIINASLACGDQLQPWRTGSKTNMTACREIRATRRPSHNNAQGTRTEPSSPYGVSAIADACCAVQRDRQGRKAFLLFKSMREGWCNIMTREIKIRAKKRLNAKNLRGVRNLLVARNDPCPIKIPLIKFHELRTNSNRRREAYVKISPVVRFSPLGSDGHIFLYI